MGPANQNGTTRCCSVGHLHTDRLRNSSNQVVHWIVLVDKPAVDTMHEHLAQPIGMERTKIRMMGRVMAGIRYASHSSRFLPSRFAVCLAGAQNTHLGTQLVTPEVHHTGCTVEVPVTRGTVELRRLQRANGGAYTRFAVEPAPQPSVVLIASSPRSMRPIAGPCLFPTPMPSIADSDFESEAVLAQEIPPNADRRQGWWQIRRMCFDLIPIHSD